MSKSFFMLTDSDFVEFWRVGISEILEHSFTHRGYLVLNRKWKVITIKQVSEILLSDIDLMLSKYDQDYMGGIIERVNNLPADKRASVLDSIKQLLDGIVTTYEDY